jgi:hypothetical protein
VVSSQATASAQPTPMSTRGDAAVEISVPQLEPSGSRAAANRGNRMAELRAYDDAKIRKHWSDPVDPAWATTATPALRSGLEELSKSGRFRVNEVDCRDTSCVATFRWPSFADAEAEYGDLARAPLDVNCSRGITLPDVEDKKAPLEATMYFDCASWKANGSQFLSAATR